MLKLSRLELLRELYKRVFIPTAVFHEIELGKAKRYYQDVSKIDWIEIQDIRDKHAVKYFLDLDAGEAESIVLASEIGADLIILDEKLGRFHAKHADLKVTGTIGVLLRAKHAGLIRHIKPLLIDLTEKDVWISDKLISEVLERAGEK